MKIPGTQSGQIVDPELARLIQQMEEAHLGLSTAVKALVDAPALVPLRPPHRHRPDQYVGAKVQSPLGDEGSASSVAPRVRSGSGSPVHEVLASQGTLGADSVRPDGTLFAWDPEADTSLDQISTRKLLAYYEGSMRDLHGSMGRMDFDRKEGMWYERYREDLWREIDADDGYYRAQSDYSDRQYYSDIEADRMAAESSLQSSSYYDYDDR